MCLLSSDMGWIAVVMLVFFNGVVFAGVQFAITIMRMEQDDEPRGGKFVPVATDVPVPVEATDNITDVEPSLFSFISAV